LSLKLLSYNIRYGGAGRESQLADVIRGADPDLVVLQEASDPRVVERLSEETGLKTWAAQRGRSIAYLSRVAVKRHEWHRPRGSRRHFMEIELEGSDLVVFGIHLSAVHSFWTERPICAAQIFSPVSAESRSTTRGSVASCKTTRSGSASLMTAASGASRPDPPYRTL